MKSPLALMLVASAMLIACKGQTQASLEKKHKQQEARYYVFGIHMVPGKVSDSIYKTYGIKVISSSCVLDKDKLALNKQVDSMMLAKHHKSMSELLASAN